MVPLLMLPARAAIAKKPTPTPTPDIRLSPAIQKIASDLSISASDVVRTSNNDLRKMYEALYSKQGLGLLESKKKAAAVELKN